MPDNKLKEEIFDLLKEQVKDLWRVEDDAFLSQLAADITREKVLAATSTNQKEHEQNLRHLTATLQGEVAKKNLKINKKNEAIFIRVVSTVIRTIALPALGIV